METYDYYCKKCEKTTPHKLNGDCFECILKYVPPVATDNTLTPKENSAHSFTEPVKESDGWINVKDRLPKDYERVMYWDSRETGYHEIGYFVSTQTPVPRYVTHWRPLPKAPTKN